MTRKTPSVKCPQCGKTVLWAPSSKWRPFCSERCKQLDLGAWASESYRVPTAAPDSEEQGNDTLN
ncbi:DNA gyrase inhibitor YacG [Azoarcus taiwanensis]|uniref:DNA gyrase inhibitor YacG n=1 Tax=Azoarcus taiwanensis TaxID=666964 RepID=A0A972FFV0_9RHOO|nr:DNA gyrase inhibitor YacG [Azoarcus taiwanensis]